MTDVVPFMPQHLGCLILQEAQSRFSWQRSRDYAVMLAKAGPCYSVLYRGEVVACFGIVERAPWMAQAWGLVGQKAGPAFFAIAKSIRRWLGNCQYRRVETTVLCGFDEGRRFAELLGFVKVNMRPMLGYGLNGEPHDLYERVRLLDG